MAFLGVDPSSAGHDLVGHPESASRALRIEEAVRMDPLLAGIERIMPDRPITRDEALRVHTARVWLNLESAQAIAPTFLDPDTYVVEGSWAASRGAARLALLAAQRCWESSDGGFVLTRPPGHHATRDRSMGFCHFNNVALAADRLLQLGARRVLVFDHDVHHGNGTQEIFYGSPEVLYQSFHLAPHYPGTGAVEEIGEGEGRGFTVNAPLRHGDGDAAVRALMLDLFLPVAKEFRPEAILISAGFDSLAGDPLGGLDLSAPFFGEMAARLRRISPRTVAFLEGGYQLDRIPQAAVAMLRALSGLETPMATDVHPPPSLDAVRRLLGEHWASLR